MMKYVNAIVTYVLIKLQIIEYVFIRIVLILKIGSRKKEIESSGRIRIRRNKQTRGRIGRVNLK